jgi:hypothetical protein
MFWLALIELAVTEFAMGFMDNYESARQDARRKLNERRGRVQPGPPGFPG